MKNTINTGGGVLTVLSGLGTSQNMGRTVRPKVYRTLKSWDRFEIGPNFKKLNSKDGTYHVLALYFETDPLISVIIKC